MKLGRVELQVRIGIATGLVVAGDIVGEGASEERAVLGDTPNLASRLQGLAQPNEVLVDETTRRLVGNAVEFEYLGAKVLKGLSGANLAWRALGEGGADSRFEALHTGMLTRLIGREHEQGLLLERWELSQRGEGQAVLLSGEAGIGKSRILQALKERVADEPHAWIHCQCSPHHTNSAFHPFIHWLERAARFKANDSAETKLDQLEEFLRPTGDAAGSQASLLAALLSLPGKLRYGALELSPEQRRTRTFEALASQVLQRSGEAPTLFVVEDAHWIDPTSEDLLGEILARCIDSSILILITHRPHYTTPWTGYPHVTSLALNRLSRDQSVDIVRAAGGHELSDEVTDGIIARADGVPLFIEELTKSVLEASFGDGAAAELQIPETLRASLTARLDRLSAAKEVAQIGAAIGREYSIELAEAVAAKLGLDIGASHKELVDSELVFPTFSSQGTTYTFKHALVQEAAYETMLKSRRMELHRKIAELLESEFPLIAESSPETLARHYTEGKVPRSAIAYWERAGGISAGASANVEASHHFARALELLDRQPQTEERDEWELRLRVASGGPLLMTKGHGAPEVESAYSRARELSEKLSDTSHLIPTLFGLWRFYVGRGDCNVSLDLGKQLLSLSEKIDDTPGRVLGHYGLGYTLFCRGEFKDSLTHLESGAGLYDRTLRDSLGFRLGQDPGVACLSYGALALWVLGYPDAAARRSQEAMDLADALAHPFSRAYALSLGAQVYQLRGEVEAALQLAEKAIAISREQGFAVWLASPTIFRGWARGRKGESEAGVREMRDGIDAIRAAGMEMRRPLYLGLLAEGNIAIGHLPEAGILVNEAMGIMERTGERWSESEQHRLAGELLVREGTDNSESEFERALDIARTQRAKSWELRAAISLGRLWSGHGRSEDAARLLRPIYEEFTEGFETGDLQQAKAVLDELH